jgi:hypothetical protein
MPPSASQLRAAFIAVSRDMDDLWDEVCAANVEHGGWVDRPRTARQERAYAAYFVARDEQDRLERALDRMEIL